MHYKWVFSSSIASRLSMLFLGVNTSVIGANLPWGIFLLSYSSLTASSVCDDTTPTFSDVAWEGLSSPDCDVTSCWTRCVWLLSAPVVTFVPDCDELFSSLEVTCTFGITLSVCGRTLLVDKILPLCSADLFFTLWLLENKIQ